MSMTPDEVAGDEYMAQLYLEHKEMAIEEYTDECLQSYYLDNRLLAKPAIDALSEARNIVNTNETAGFIFSAIAVEVGLKTTILKPIVYGFIHTDSVANLITDLTVRHRIDDYRVLLFQILNKHGGVDMTIFKRPGADKSLWEEIKDISKKRNSILHKGERASKEEANMALHVASSILETIFPAVLTKVGLHLHEGFRICDDWQCRYK